MFHSPKLFLRLCFVLSLSERQEQQASGQEEHENDDAVSPEPILPEAKLEETSEDAKPLSPLEAGGMFLQATLAMRSGLVWQHAAEAEGISIKTLQNRCYAAAEACILQQYSSWRDVLQYALHVAPDLEPVAFIERQAYDTTPGRLRIADQDGAQGERKVKVLLVETEVAVLLATRGRRETGCVDDFFLLEDTLQPHGKDSSSSKCTLYKRRFGAGVAC